ncbi:cytochrome P450 [Chiua virens]|nr:cytochrome P450 [Chiua virens]
MTPYHVSALSDGLGIAPMVAGAVAAIVVRLETLQRSQPRCHPNGWVGQLAWIMVGWLQVQNECDGCHTRGYKSAPFKVADRYHWIVVLGSRQHMEELRKAPDDTLSFHEAANETIRTEYTLGSEVYHNPYHIETVRSHLTRSLSTLYPEIRDEISVAFEEVLNLEDNEWKSIPALRAIQRVVCRTSNRLFVGLPLCRDNDWLDLNLRFTLDVVQGGKTILRFPRFLAPLVAHFMTDVPGSTKRGMKHLGPIIEERLKCLKEYGVDWADKPNDLLSWLLHDAPEGPERTVRLLTTRVLTVNFAAIHTSSNSFAHALFFLAENPQYLQPLREEVESIVEKEGWSKTSLGKMRKIDSFLKETQRLVGIGSVSLLRKALKDFTFSDGTFIPKGTSIVVPSRSLHLDNDNYENAHEFDPFRFSNMRGEEGEGTKHHFVSTSLEYLPFGHGKHACPGRFFAANELKSMLAHIVLSYDVKLEDGATSPKPMHDGPGVAADPFAKVMFRRRVY